MKMTEEQFYQYDEDFAGYCTHCDEVTEDCGVEPDAEDYVCPECELETVMGIEQAMMLGHIIIVKE